MGKILLLAIIVAFLLAILITGSFIAYDWGLQNRYQDVKPTPSTGTIPTGF